MINFRKKFVCALVFVIPGYALSAEIATIEGNWSTSPEAYETLISSSTSQTNKMMIIRRDGGTVNQTLINITVDGIPFSGPLHQGGEILLTGKKITLSQSPKDTLRAVGTWALIDRAQQTMITTKWSVSPSSGDSHTIIAALDEPHEFVIRYYQGSGCTGGRMSVRVDQKFMDAAPGNDAGTIRFLPGSAVIGKGKYVEIFLSGKCEGDNSHTGSFSLLPLTP